MTSYIPVITAMLCVTALATVAMLKGLDGTVLAGAMTIIGGLGGYQASKLIAKISQKPAPTTQPKIDKTDEP